MEIYQDDIRDLLRSPAEPAAGFQPQTRMVMGSTETLPRDKGINIRENSEGAFLDGVRYRHLCTHCNTFLCSHKQRLYKNDVQGSSK